MVSTFQISLLLLMVPVRVILRLLPKLLSVDGGLVVDILVLLVR